MKKRECQCGTFDVNKQVEFTGTIMYPAIGYKKTDIFPIALATMYDVGQWCILIEGKLGIADINFCPYCGTDLDTL